MQNDSSIIAMKPLNKVLSTFPNSFWTLHNGAVDADPAVTDTVIDQGTLGLDLTVRTPGATQWTARDAMWNIPATNPNITLALKLAATSGNLANFTQLFNFTGKWLFCAKVKSLGAGNNGRLMSLYDGDNTNSSQFLDMRHSVGQALAGYCVNEGTIGSADMTAATSGEGYLFWLVDNGVAKSGVTYLFDSTTQTLAELSSPTTFASKEGTAGEITKALSDYKAAVGDTFALGNRWTGTIYNATNGVNNIDMSRVRIINFGADAPDDLSELMQELVWTGLTGTRREY